MIAPGTRARSLLEGVRDAVSPPEGTAPQLVAAIEAATELLGLANVPAHDFPPGSNLEALKPSSELFTEVDHWAPLPGVSKESVQHGKN